MIGQRAGKQRFPRSSRLLRHADFERVYKQGRRHFSPAMTVFYLQRLPPATGTKVISGLRVGFTVGKPLGEAVQRNRMKRRLREAVRLTLAAGGVNADVVINPKKSMLTVDFAVILTEVTRAFEVVERKLRTQSPESEESSTRRLPQNKIRDRKPD